MGPVGQIVKAIFYTFLGVQLVLSAVIYVLATSLLCSRMIIPSHILMHAALALILAICTLGIIHKGFQAVFHDCPYHLYWFAVIFIILILIQFLFEMFGFRQMSRKVWQQSLANDGTIADVEIDYDLFNNSKKLAYRLPSSDELEARKRKLYGIEPEILDEGVSQSPFEEETKKRRPPLYRRRRPSTHIPSQSHRKNRIGVKDPESKIENNGGSLGNDDENNEEVEKLRETPIVLIFHGYSLILKIACAAFAILTGFLYQLEFV